MTQSGFSRVAAPPPTLSRHAADTARLAAPLAIAQLSQMAMGVTDTILLGSLGPDALAAGGLGANLFFVVVTLLQGVLTSVSVSVSHARGAQAEDRVPHIYWTGLVMSVLLSMPAFVLLSFATPILLAFGEPALLAHNVGEYAAVLRWGALGSLIGIGLMRSFLPAIGAAKRLLWVSIVGVFVNGFLNYGLIHGAYGLPRLGFLGSAAATTITVWMTALVLMAWLHLRPRYRHFVIADAAQIAVDGRAVRHWLAGRDHLWRRIHAVPRHRPDGRPARRIATRRAPDRAERRVGGLHGAARDRPGGQRAGRLLVRRGAAARRAACGLRRDRARRRLHDAVGARADPRAALDRRPVSASGRSRPTRPRLRSPVRCSASPPSSRSSTACRRSARAACAA